MTKVFIDIELGQTSDGSWGADAFEVDPVTLKGSVVLMLRGCGSEAEAYERICGRLDRVYGKGNWGC